MILDLILVVFLILALIKGYQRGLIVGVFSFLAIIIGLAAAIKLSAAVAGYIGKTTSISEQWLPVISFAIVFIIVILLVRLGANAIERTVEIAMLGWVNKIGGMLFYGAICILIYSVFLFYAEQMELISPDTIAKSASYSYVQSLGPKTIESFGSVIPVFKNMFADLQDFFGNIAKNISSFQTP
ncbi:MAG TPA: CvpA family protein [Chitinophagaceae bacterium]|nr:CvpA family protein [Chitinophagaceae bacterium]